MSSTLAETKTLSSEQQFPTSPVYVSAPVQSQAEKQTSLLQISNLSTNTILLDFQEHNAWVMSCAPHLASGKKFVKKAFDSWRLKLLLAVGVETIGPAINERWEGHRTSQDLFLFKPVLTDFNPQQVFCPFCIIGAPELRSIMSVKDDSGVSSNSTTPAVSPRVDVLNSLCTSHEPQVNPDLVQQIMYQQAVQLEMYHNMQMMMGMHLPTGSMPQMTAIPQMTPVAPHLPFSAEMQKMIMDGQIPYPNPGLLAQQQFAWHQMMMAHMHRIQQTQPSKEQSTSRPAKEDTRPLDLSRKSGLDGILELDTSQLKKVINLEEGSTPYDSDEALSEVKFRPPKRNYSQMDLDAAVSDIRNGKLGTRRASVVYGIPRSTLRNKIYKLEAADELIGIPVTYKRRRPAEKNQEEKKPVEVVVESEKSNSDSPSDESSVNSTDQPIEDPDSPPKLASIQETIEAVRLNSANGWPATIWAQLFSSGGSPEHEQKKFVSRKEENDWKKSRPKRGQYRKYDKNALDEAVQSVRRGEMSVHRAGSFYGVPHSTLEYKVKERNLMRKKKCDENDKTGEEMPPGSVDLAIRSLQEVLSN